MENPRQMVWNIQAHQSLPNLWTGQTIFHIKPQYENQLSELPVINTCTETAIAGQEIEIALNVEELEACMRQDVPEQIAFLASAAKRQRAEIKERDLSPSEMKLFQGAKNKEIQSWLSTETVRRIARNQIPEEQILRSRWVLTWKPVDPTTQDPNPQPKAKARLVILVMKILSWKPLPEILQLWEKTLGHWFYSLLPPQSGKSVPSTSKQPSFEEVAKMVEF